MGPLAWKAASTKVPLSFSPFRSTRSLWGRSGLIANSPPFNRPVTGRCYFNCGAGSLAGAPRGSCMKKILLIEDDADLFSLLQYNLEKEGFLLTGLQTGRGAIELSRKVGPDLILLDIMLPDS